MKLNELPEKRRFFPKWEDLQQSEFDFCQSCDLLSLRQNFPEFPVLTEKNPDQSLFFSAPDQLQPTLCIDPGEI
jgi:hypothetical protein